MNCVSLLFLLLRTCNHECRFPAARAVHDQVPAAHLVMLSPSSRSVPSGAGTHPPAAVGTRPLGHGPGWQSPQDLGHCWRTVEETSQICFMFISAGSEGVTILVLMHLW